MFRHFFFFLRIDELVAEAIIANIPNESICCQITLLHVCCLRSVFDVFFVPKQWLHDVRSYYGNDICFKSQYYVSSTFTYDFRISDWYTSHTSEQLKLSSSLANFFPHVQWKSQTISWYGVMEYVYDMYVIDKVQISNECKQCLSTNRF